MIKVKNLSLNNRIINFFQIAVKFANQEVVNSPFNVYVEGKVGDPNRCRAFGPGIEPTGNIVDKPTYFEADTSSRNITSIFHINI